MLFRGGLLSPRDRYARSLNAVKIAGRASRLLSVGRRAVDNTVSRKKTLALEKLEERGDAGLSAGRLLL